MLHHIALGARDVSRVAAFYRDILGLTERTRHHYEDGRLRSIWLDLGCGVLMIEHTADPPRHVEGVGAGPFLLAIRVADEGARAHLERACSDAGLPIEDRTTYTSYARDPEGNRVAWSTYPL